MYVKKAVASVAIVATLALGYIAGAYIGVPFVDENSAAGDIGKAKSLNEAQDPEVLAFMEQLAGDATVQQETAASLALLTDRVEKMDSITSATVKATENVKVLAALNEDMKAINRRTQNAKKALAALSAEIEKVVEGEKSECFEQLSNNAYVAYSVLNGCLDVCPDYIDLMCEYLEENENKDVAAVSSAWIKHCTEEAVLSGDKEVVEAWSNIITNLKESDVMTKQGLADMQLGGMPDVKVYIDALSKNPPRGLSIALRNQAEKGLRVQHEVLMKNGLNTISKNVLSIQGGGTILKMSNGLNSAQRGNFLGRVKRAPEVLDRAKKMNP